jgi:two-component system response regulator YesN
MARARQLIHEHYARPLSLDWLSEQLDVSPYYLSRVFSAESGFRLSDYLTSVRLAAARSLLADGSAPVADIARAVGYRDAHYFAKVFKRAFGQSPSRFRRRAAAD